MKISTSSAILLNSLVLTACGGSDMPAQAPRESRLLAATTSASGITSFTGPRANYTIARTAGGVTVTDNAGNDGSVTLVDPARLVFSDVGIAFDVNGNAGTAYRVYQAAFNRTPDAAGLGYWIAQMDKGQTLGDVAAGFTTSAEFAAQYGTRPRNADIIGRFYQNVLHRAPDQGGFDYWTGVLDAKTATVASVLAGFSESDENKAQVADAIANGITYTVYRPAPSLPALTAATFANCPDASNAQSPAFYQCMVGTMTGKTVFGDKACTLTIAADGTVTLATQAAARTLYPTYTFPLYTKMTINRPDAYQIIADAHDRYFTHLAINATSPAYAAMAPGMPAGLQVDLGTLNDTLSCTFAL